MSRPGWSRRGRTRSSSPCTRSQPTFDSAGPARSRTNACRAARVGSLTTRSRKPRGAEHRHPHVGVVLVAEVAYELDEVGDAAQARPGERPAVAHHREPLEGGQVERLGRQAVEQLGRVLHAEEAPATVVGDDGLVCVDRDAGRLAFEEHLLVVAVAGAEHDRHHPASGRLGGGEGVGPEDEAALGQFELAIRVHPRGRLAPRVAALEDPRVHHARAPARPSPPRWRPTGRWSRCCRSCASARYSTMPCAERLGAEVAARACAGRPHPFW